MSSVQQMMTEDFGNMSGFPFMPSAQPPPDYPGPSSNNNNDATDGYDDDELLEMKAIGAGRSVKIDDSESENTVDLMIFLPQVDKQWLDEWSDYGSTFDVKAGRDDVESGDGGGVGSCPGAAGR
jgi:hypothetical protein